MDVLRSFTFADLVRENARSFPDRTALVCGDERWTYPETDARSSGLAAWLRTRGVARGDRVLWLAQNCHRFVELLFACAKLGAVVVPANWRGSAEELSFVVEDAGPKVVVHQAEEIGERVQQVRREGEWVALEDLPSAPGEEPQANVHEDDPVVCVYTAAFEGRPRGALITHRNLVTTDLHLAVAHGYSSSDVHLASGPLFHVLTLMVVTTVFHVGGTNVMVRRVSPEDMCRLIDSEKVTRAVVLPPTILSMVEAAERGGWSLTSLRTPRMRGGPEMERWLEMTTPDLSHIGGYGQTEVTGLATMNAYGPRGEGRHGRAAPLAAVRVVDPDGRELPPGETGEIVVRGPQVFAGYLDRGDVNAERFRGGWQHTGDLGRREPDGSITFIGPLAELIKTGAENVYPAEVEAVLTRHPAVKDACVIGVPDPQWGQSVKAIVILGSDATAADLVEHCRTHLAGFKKPKYVEFVDSLPRAQSGVLDREAVKRAHGGGP